MPWVEVGVAVVDDDFDDIVVFHDDGVDLAVDQRVGDIFLGKS